MSTADKLNKILQSKEAIRQSIIAKGTDVSEDTPLSQYASKIDEIQTGSGETYKYPEFYELVTKNGTDFSNLFSGIHFSTDAALIEKLDTSNVTNMSEMFYGSSLYSSILDVNKERLDLSGWDTSKVKTMNSMFKFGSFHKLRISGWDTSNVTNMSEMFYGTKIYDNSELDFSGWDTSNVTNMSKMFGTCNVTKITGLENWDVRNVTEMEGLFYEVQIETLNISGWDTSNFNKFTNLSNQFVGSSTKNSAFKTIIGEIDLSGCTSGMAYSANYYCFKNLNALEIVYLKNIYKNVEMKNDKKWSINLKDTVVKDECLIYIIDELPDLINDKGLTDTSTIILTLPPTNTLTQEQVQPAIDKGWNVANITF